MSALEAFPDGSAQPVSARAVLAGADRLVAGERRALRKQEIAIAARFRRGAQWPYAVAALGGGFGWLAMLALALTERIGLGVAAAFSCVFCCSSYLLAHEAIHHNIVSRGSRWHWLNEACGWLALLPLVLPLSVARVVHLRHHTHVNDPERDPDYGDAAPNLWAAIWQSWINRQPGGANWQAAYRRCCEQVGAGDAMNHALAMSLGFMAALFAMAWSGHAMVAALVWWLPRHIGLTYSRVLLSWAPHHPRGRGTGRYENTRVFRPWIGDFGSSFMGYHIVHHLYPGIPLHRTRAAFHALRPVLEARGVDCSAQPGA